MVGWLVDWFVRSFVYLFRFIDLFIYLFIYFLQKYAPTRETTFKALGNVSFCGLGWNCERCGTKVPSLPEKLFVPVNFVMLDAEGDLFFLRVCSAYRRAPRRDVKIQQQRPTFFINIRF